MSSHEHIGGTPIGVKVFTALEQARKIAHNPVREAGDRTSVQALLDSLQETADFQETVAGILREVALTENESYHIALFAGIHLDHLRRLSCVKGEDDRARQQDLSALHTAYNTQMVAADKTFLQYGKSVAAMYGVSSQTSYNWFVLMRNEGRRIGDAFFNPTVDDPYVTIYNARNAMSAIRNQDPRIEAVNMETVIAHSGVELTRELAFSP